MPDQAPLQFNNCSMDRGRDSSCFTLARDTALTDSVTDIDGDEATPDADDTVVVSIDELLPDAASTG